jgi:hypothetical protein
MHFISLNESLEASYISNAEMLGFSGAMILGSLQLTAMKKGKKAFDSREFVKISHNLKKGFSGKTYESSEQCIL